MPAKPTRPRWLRLWQLRINRRAKTEVVDIHRRIAMISGAVLLGLVALAFAAAGDRVASARRLLDKGAKVGAEAENGSTALGIASERENKAVIEVLQQAAASRGTRPGGKAAN